MTLDRANSSLSWVCLFTQARQERLACLSLRDVGLEAYLPLYETVIAHARKRRAEVRPLFTRYLFARMKDNPDIVRTAYRLPGVSGFVGKSYANSLVADGVIDLIRSRETANGLVAMDYSHLKSGQKVKLLSGPFAGFEAIFSEPDDKKRSWIFVEFLGKLHHVKIDNLHITTAR